MAVVHPNEANAAVVRIVTDQVYRMRLFKNDFIPDEDTVIGDLDVCDYDGFSEQVVTWGAITITGEGKARRQALPLTFTHDGGATGNDVYGWYMIVLIDSVEKLLFVERFDDGPYPMNDLGDFIVRAPVLFEDQGA